MCCDDASLVLIFPVLVWQHSEGACEAQSACCVVVAVPAFCLWSRLARLLSPFWTVPVLSTLEMHLGMKVTEGGSKLSSSSRSAGRSFTSVQPAESVWPWVTNKRVLGQALAHQRESGWWPFLLPMVQLSSGGTPCRCCRMLLLRCPPLPLLLLLPLSSRPQKLPTRDEELFQMQIRDKAFFHDSSVIPDGAEISSYLFRDTPKRYFCLHQVKKLYFENSSFICWVFWSQYWIQVTKIQMPEFCLVK